MRVPHPARISAAVLLLVGIAVALQLPRLLAAQSPGCAVSAADLYTDAEEQAALDAINALRAESRLAPLSQSAPLTQAATWKSVSMAATGLFSHDDAGRGWAQRIQDCGYRSAATENIAVGVESGRAAVQIWRDSPLHTVNMLDPAARVVGIARARSAGNVWYWTGVFGRAAETPEPVRATPSPTPAPPATPTQAAAATAGMPAASLMPGTPATVNAGAGDCLNLRAEPSIMARPLACLPDGASVTITAGPRDADGITWWQLDGLGWASGEFLRSSVTALPGPMR
jgi:uncharacterized protein YkwD